MSRNVAALKVDAGEGIGLIEEKEEKKLSRPSIKVPLELFEPWSKTTNIISKIPCLLKVMAELVNHFPEVLIYDSLEQDYDDKETKHNIIPSDPLKQFEEYQQKYQQLVQQFQQEQKQFLNTDRDSKTLSSAQVSASIPKFIELSIKTTETFEKLHKYLIQALKRWQEDACDKPTENPFLQNYSKQGLKLWEEDKSDESATEAKTSKKTVDENTVKKFSDKIALLVKMIHQVGNAASLNLSPSVQIDEDLKRNKIIDESLKILVKIRQTIKKSSLQNLNELRKAMKEPFEKLRMYQHHIVAFQKTLRDFDALLTKKSVIVTSMSQWLASENYSDLLFFTAVLKPETVIYALKRRFQYFFYLNQKAKKNLENLKQTWDENTCLEALRCMRIQQSYKRWKLYLQVFNEKLEEDRLSVWEKNIRTQRLLTYEKKAFFKQGLTQGQDFLLIQKLTKWTKIYSDGSELIKCLQEKNRKQRQEIAKQESALTDGQSRWQKCFATAWLSISQQPDYQLGELAFLDFVKQTDKLSKDIPILSEPLPLDMQKSWSNYTGLAFFSIALSTSNYLGYYAHLIGAINRVIISQVSLWFPLGSAIDRSVVQPLIPTLSALAADSDFHPGLRYAASMAKTALRCDEISLLENESWILWLNGLWINLLLMPTQAWIPVILGYICATAATSMVLHGIDVIGHYKQIALESSLFVKVIVHLFVYTKANQQGVAWGAQLLPIPAPKQMSASEALQNLGFLKPPSNERELQKVYHSLSRRFHPDTCIAEDCIGANDKMMMINEANQVLLQQFHRKM